MKKWELFVLQIFAVTCSYLILSITFASALEIKIYTSENEEFTTDLYEFSDFIQKDFYYPYKQNYQYLEIQLSSKNPNYIINKIYLFRCKDLNPLECIDNGIQPVVSVNQGSGNLIFDETYKWDDVSSGEEGNFLIIAKLDVEGKEVWTGAWNKVTRTGVQKFKNDNYKMDRLNVYLKSGVPGENVKSYIETYHSIPSDNMNNTVFETIGGSSVEKLQDLAGNDDEIDPSGTGIPDFYTGTFEGNSFNYNLKAWDFVFGSNGKVAEPVVFYSTSAGPPITPRGPKLIIDDLSPQIVSCNSDEVIKASLHVDNASDIGYYQSYYYEIDGVKAGSGSITCSIINPNQSIYSYECSIPVANFPVCNAPDQSIMTFYFNYESSVRLSAGFPVTLKAPEPKLVVNSVLPIPFDCGIDTELTAQLQVVNPMDATPETYYTFDGTNFHPLACSGSGALYTCSIQENDICSLLQENLELTFKLVYDELEVLSLPTEMFVTFPPPSMGVDTVTPQTVQAGDTTSVNVILHVNYPDFITYQEDGFSYKYLDKGFQPVTCSLENSCTDIKYYKCPVELEIPITEDGVKTLSFRLDGYVEGSTEQLTANFFFEILPPPPEPELRIVYTSSPLDCIQDSTFMITAKLENTQETPDKTHYSVDNGQNYQTLSCTSSGQTFTCTIPKDDLCDLMDNVLPLTLKFEYASGDLISSTQNIYIDLPEPHMQVYSIQPDTLSTGEKNLVMVKLYIQYPKMAGDNPIFLYSYLGKATQEMSCSKVSSTNIRDFYECTDTEFDIPETYSQSSLAILFSIQGSTISFPMTIPVSVIEKKIPWMEIVSTTPSRIETTPGNQTSVSFYITIHNAVENELKHQATVIPNSWITSGTCTEANIEYDFNCDVTIKVPNTAKTGSNPVTFTVKVSNKKTYEFSNITDVYVLAEEMLLDVQTISPDKLYCDGHTQQNPDTVKITASVKNLADFRLVEEDLYFNGLPISSGAKYCTSQGKSITCQIPTTKLLGKVRCGTGNLAPGEGAHYYPLRMNFVLDSAGELETVSGSGDVSVEARALEAYLQIEDNNVIDGVLQTPINCLGSQTLKIGDTGYVRIMYADLLHPQPKEEDIKWTFRLDAYDDKGKLTKGMGISPQTNATICKFRDYQSVGVHRVEDYECTFYVDTKMFQRCSNGEGEILVTATAGGKKAEGRILADIIRDDSKYQVDMEIVTEPQKEIDCQIHGYGGGAKCSFASNSNQNVTIRIYNRNQDVELTDLKLYNFDVDMTGKIVDANPRTLGNCREDSREAHKYLCPFQIGPSINLPEDTHNVTKDKDTYETISLGRVNMTVYVKYANDLASTTIGKMDGTITIRPKKSDAMINAEAMMQKMQKTFKDFENVFKWIIQILSFCTVCMAGNAVVDSVKGAITSSGGNVKSECEKCIESGPGKAWCLADGSCKSSSSDCKGIFTQVTSGCPVAQTSSESGGSAGASDGDSVGEAITIIGSITGIFLLGVLLTKQINFGGEPDVEEEKSEIMEAMEKGIEWGVIACVLPRIVGELGAWIAPPDSGVEKGFGVVSAFGKGVGDVCKVVMTMLPMVMGFIQFYISYLQFEMCMNMVQMQLEMSTQAAAQSPEGAYQAQAGAQAAMQMMTNMMNCFNTIMQAMNQLTMTMMFTTQQFGTMGGGQTSARVMYKGADKPDGATICGDDTLYVHAYNFCKGGAREQSISIIGDGCSPSVFKQETCYYQQSYMPTYPTYGGMYGGYGGYQQQGTTMTDEMSMTRCTHDTTINVVVKGVTTKTVRLNYKKQC